MNLNKRKIEKSHEWDLGLGACGVFTWLNRSWISHLVMMEQRPFGQWGLRWHDRSFEFSMALLESSCSIEKSDDEQTGLFELILRQSNLILVGLGAMMLGFWLFLWRESICQFCTWFELLHCVHLNSLSQWIVIFKLRHSS